MHHQYSLADERHDQWLRQFHQPPILQLVCVVHTQGERDSCCNGRIFDSCHLRRLLGHLINRHGGSCKQAM